MAQSIHNLLQNHNDNLHNGIYYNLVTICDRALHNPLIRSSVCLFALVDPYRAYLNLSAICKDKAIIPITPITSIPTTDH